MCESVEEFLARGGKVTSVTEGARTSTNKELYNLSRGEKIAEIDQRFGGTLSDSQLLSVAEHEACE